MTAILVILILVSLSISSWLVYRAVTVTKRSVVSTARELSTRFSDTVQCQSCGKSYPSVVQFPCDRCGFVAKRNIASKCPECGFRATAASCPSCGRSILFG